MTPTNDAELDVATLQAYREFRLEARGTKACATSSRCSLRTCRNADGSGAFPRTTSSRGPLAGDPARRPPLVPEAALLRRRRRCRSWPRMTRTWFRGFSAALGDYLRRVLPARGRPAQRRPRGAVRPQDQGQRAPADVRRATCAGSPTASSTPGVRAAPTTPTSTRLGITPRRSLDEDLLLTEPWAS